VWSSHAANQISLDSKAEERRQVAALMRGPHARLQRARISVRLLIGAAKQVEEPDSRHLS
jgi:hypothetical protein